MSIDATPHTIRIRRVVSFQIVLAWLALVVFASGARANDQVNIAGTFNNWATAADEWCMEQIDDTNYRLGHFIEPGTYQFKFVFGNSWDRHLGAADGNRLDMPGRDIDLTITSADFYQFMLDTEGKTWAIKTVAPPHVIPILNLQRRAHHQYTLDASRSLVPDRTNREAVKYEFTVVPAESPNDASSLKIAPIDRASAQLTLSRAGTFRLKLTARLDNGEPKSTEFYRRLGTGFDLLVADETSALQLQQLDEHRFATVLPTSRSGQSVSLRGFTLSNPKTIDIPESPDGKPLLLIADDRTNEIQMKTNDWHEFVFDSRKFRREHADVSVERVNLVGDFNGWNGAANEMISTDDRTYRTIVELPEGVHHYKFLVNGTTFAEDFKSDPRFRKSDGNGGFNSGILIGDDAAKFGVAKPGTINIDALKHDPNNKRYFEPIASNVARFTVRTLANDVDQVRLRGLSGDNDLMLAKSKTVFGFDYWSVQTDLQNEEIAEYYFILEDKAVESSGVELKLDRSVSYGNNWATSLFSAHQAPVYKVKLSKMSESPDWARRAVWYQIFPERFRNGDNSNDPPRTVPWSHAWDKPYKPGPEIVKGSPQDFEEKGAFFDFIFDRRYGGDLQGVREKLPYLRDLGITAIYFNPIFQAESLHKYDASDFRHIDDGFGVAGSLSKIKGETTDPATWQWSDSDKVFLEFLNEAHRLGFKVIIDGVFNHTGREFWAFQDILKNGKQSPYADWFEIKSWEPFEYEAWDKPNGSLPKLKHDEALGLITPIREHLFAVTRRWMDPNGDGDPSDGIDGWRLDVASDINANFWRDWRKVVKETNPDAYIVAELWQQSQEWLDGETFDAVMNYPFARRCMRFVINNMKAITPTQFKKEIDEMLAWYRPQVNYVLQNLFDSHDTDRVASMCMNPDLEYDRENRIQDNGPKYEPGKPTPACYERVKLLASIQMTFLGAPMIYYGDEAGLHGADDPSDRKPMLWPDLLPYDDPDERIEPDVLDHYRRMIAIRNSYPALQVGTYESILADDANRIFAFSRTLGNETVIVVINNSDEKATTAVPVPWTDIKSIVRLDDPAQCELVMPGNENPTARPMVRPIANRPETNGRIESGNLHGITIKPRSAAILTTTNQ